MGGEDLIESDGAARHLRSRAPQTGQQAQLFELTAVRVAAG